jgi:hypothetical protein
MDINMLIAQGIIINIDILTLTNINIVIIINTGILTRIIIKLLMDIIHIKIEWLWAIFIIIIF